MTHNNTSATVPTGSIVAPQQRIVQIALTQARPVVERVIETTRMSLQARLDSARTPGEHHAMQEARQQLVRLASVMAERYPDALRKALDEDTAQGDDKPTRSLFTVNFDDLELMDEAQINDSVERARARQVLVTAVEGPLADLDALVCAAQGLPRVQPEHNPLRPDVFLQALQSVVSQMQVTPQVRHDWMGLMAQALGTELRSLYLTQIDQLKQSGVKPVGYAMRQATGEVVYVAPAEAGVSPGFAADNDLYVASTSAGDPLLTLDRLRRLLLGEFNDAAAPAETHAPANDSQESFADRFAREFEDPAQGLPHIDPPATDFAMTVPAAFEALQEMNQVGQMMERLGTPRPPAAPAADGHPTAVQRAQVQGLGQALSMEVVALMVDNIARDTRLLWPVQQFIRALEPALMQLALSDPRFFSHKEHAARRLLQDITDRSQAFNSPEAPGFQSFMRSLMHIAGPLATATIESADDFEQVLQQLHAKWAEKDQALKQERQRAIEALQHAEQRHLLAAQISRELWLLPSMAKVPDAISRFLLGPWAQVMAEARLSAKPGTTDPGRYQELVDALIWSVQPELTRANTGQLARLLPKLLPKLREGLASIDYPADRTEAVFELLMQLHQQAFTPGPRVAAPAPAAPVTAAPMATPAAEPAQPAPLDDDDPWVAPSEARESGYIDISQSPESEGADSAPEATPSNAAPLQLPASTITVGTWVNLQVAGQWERTQLSWIGSHGNLFLFTSASGRTQSMTLRLLDRLLQQGALQVLAEQTVVDNALNAVAQTAMQNSVESRH
ncbi:hypothetical protein J2W88_004279 [Acidovorax delafieldii]|uniref:DUF1631 family protein n=1 Tax=Acidovorax delafieldii TaxID=47920 RepID=A0AAJ2F3K4_ACIDE|nr:hypothetical protein [Acidovorax delafieldii]MDR6839351.1 hypothetical protein [Acidovorax delafieldii]MDR7368902.1 hypothetical protein [Acidovorax delafieldii]